MLFPPADAFDLDWAGLRRHLVREMPGFDVDAVIAGMRKLRPQATPSDLYFTVTTEIGMGAGARTVVNRKAEARAAPAYLYRLNGNRVRTAGGWRSLTDDVALVFNNVGASATVVRHGQAQQVADAMSAAWLRFARTGNPNGPGLAYWPPFDRTHQQTMVFNAVSRAVSDPVREVRLLLAPPLANQWQMPGGRGDQQRHYFFTDANQEMPYRLHVPASYDANRKTALVVALHGYGGNQDTFFDAANLRELCDRYGFILVAPMVYTPTGWYGARSASLAMDRAPTYPVCPRSPLRKPCVSGSSARRT